MSEKKAGKYSVSQFILRAGFGLECVAARLLLMWYGSKKFIGISDAKATFTEGEVCGSDQELEEKGILPIGCGLGRYGREVEHPALQVANDLNVATRTSIVPLLEVFSSKKGNGSQLRLEVLLSPVRRGSKSTGHNETLWTMTLLLNAVIYQREFCQAAIQKEITLQDIFDRMNFPDPKIQQHMAGQVKKSMAADPDKDVTELSYVIRALFRYPDLKNVVKSAYTEEMIVKWVSNLLNAFYEQQCDVWKAVDEVRSIKLIRVPAHIGNNTDPLKLLVCTSDNDQVRSAAMSKYGCEAHIVLQKEKASGRYHVYFNSKITGLSGKNLGKMIEWWESSDAVRSKLRWLEIGKFEDKVSGVGWWGFDKKENLHNGTKYYPKKVSSLTTDNLVAFMKHAFDLGQLKAWCKEYDITMSDDAHSGAKPTSTPKAPIMAEETKVKAGNGMVDALMSIDSNLFAIK